MQNHVLYSIRKEGNSVFTRVSTSLWTPHAELREGSWGAEVGRMECARQRHVHTGRDPRHLEPSTTRHQGTDREAECRPTCRRSTITQFESFLCEKGVGPEERARCFKQLGKVSISMPVVRTPELAVEEVGPMIASEIIPDEEQLAEAIPDAPRAD